MKKLNRPAFSADATYDMYKEPEDKWRAASRRAGAKAELPHPIVRFSRKLLVAGALFLIIVSVCDVL